MADLSNNARVGEAFDLLARGLEPFVDRNMARTVAKGEDWADVFVRTSKNPQRDYSTTDPSFLLNVMIEAWRGTFERQLPRSVRNLLFTLRDRRNDWAHNGRIQSHDAQFVLSGILTLLEAVDASEANQVRLSLDDLNRSLFEKERRARTKQGEAALRSNITDAPTAGLRPWRDVITPHADVISGELSMAEFAADLELVRNGEGGPEYADPRAFFDRTYLTEGLRELLTLGVKRVTGTGGQPVINCQTNFGGGKTHSLIALYHLFAGVDLASLPDEIAQLVTDAGVEELPPVRRAVVVGNRFGAGETHPKPDGTVVNTIWGEIAWQLGGPDGYALVAESDRSRTNPGDAIRDVLKMAAPCLILVDEWVAYARELVGRDDLVGGSFDSQFGFAQALTEAARATPGVLFVVSIPASQDSSEDGNVEVSSLEVGSAAGQAALERLTNVVSRQAEQWQPAKGDESFEIVRRRLFEPLADAAKADRDATIVAFGELYRSQRGEFPTDTAAVAYEERMAAAYPIHPEVFDRLYEDWSTVERFQRTRGVLRLAAAVINSLWESDDQSPMILPCSIPLDDIRVRGELAGKLPDYWDPVLDADVDGRSSRSAQIDREVPHLGKHHATRRVARTIFLGATPNIGSANRGLEMDRIRLGSVFAGEKPGFVADALNRLAAQAPYLYVDRDRYWFDRQQNVNRTARDEAAKLLKGDKHEVFGEIARRLKAQRGTGEFHRVHVAPPTSGDVADDPMTRLVVLGPEHPHLAKAEDSAAIQVAREILDHRGTSPRIYRNMLVFAAADQRSMEGLESATADYLAWTSITERVEELNLDEHQRAQARTRRAQSDDAVDLRITETYKYALVPRQDEPAAPLAFDVQTLDSQGDIAQRVSRRMIADGSLATQFPPIMLRQALNGPLASRWENGHVSVATLWEDFARYGYLRRLRDLDVLVACAQAGPASTSWQQEGFATAVEVDETTRRYLGLVAGSQSGPITPTALVVRPDIAAAQVDADAASAERTDGTHPADAAGRLATAVHQPTVDAPDRPAPVTTFHGSVRLDGTRPVMHFGSISAEVLDHLIGLAGTDVTITIDVDASCAEGFDERTIRVVTENARTLKFEDGTGFSDT